MSSKSAYIPLILQELHSTLVGGHSGFLRTYRRVAGNLFWIGMKNYVHEFVRSCDVCQRQKYSASSPAGLLQPLPIPQQVWEDISLDFITGLPKSKGLWTLHTIETSLHSKKSSGGVHKGGSLFAWSTPIHCKRSRPLVH